MVGRKTVLAMDRRREPASPPRPPPATGGGRNASGGPEALENLKRSAREEAPSGAGEIFQSARVGRAGAGSSAERDMQGTVGTNPETKERQAINKGTPTPGNGRGRDRHIPRHPARQPHTSNNICTAEAAIKLMPCIGGRRASPCKNPPYPHQYAQRSGCRSVQKRVSAPSIGDDPADATPALRGGPRAPKTRTRHHHLDCRRGYREGGYSGIIRARDRSPKGPRRPRRLGSREPGVRSAAKDGRWRKLEWRFCAHLGYWDQIFRFPKADMASNHAGDHICVRSGQG